MSRAEVEEHAQNYSQKYAADKNKSWSMWAKNFDQMAIKTVLKKLLKNWGILSVEMQTAIQADQSAGEKNTFTYVDNGGQSEFVNDATGETLFEGNTETAVSVPF